MEHTSQFFSFFFSELGCKSIETSTITSYEGIRQRTEERENK